MPPPKPVPNNQKNQDVQQDEYREQSVAERPSLRTTSGPERTNVAEDGQVRSAAGQPFAPEYRMPPLYGEEQSSGQAQQAASLQTHSSKFPVSYDNALEWWNYSTVIFVNHFSAVISGISPENCDCRVTSFCYYLIFLSLFLFLLLVIIKIECIRMKIYYGIVLYKFFLLYKLCIVFLH